MVLISLNESTQRVTQVLPRSMNENLDSVPLDTKLFGDRCIVHLLHTPKPKSLRLNVWKFRQIPNDAIQQFLECRQFLRLICGCRMIDKGERKQLSLGDSSPLAHSVDRAPHGQPFQKGWPVFDRSAMTAFKGVSENLLVTVQRVRVVV
jgi:hypothetical protein